MAPGRAHAVTGRPTEQGRVHTVLRIGELYVKEGASRALCVESKKAEQRRTCLVQD